MRNICLWLITSNKSLHTVACHEKRQWLYSIFLLVHLRSSPPWATKKRFLQSCASSWQLDPLSFSSHFLTPACDSWHSASSLFVVQSTMRANPPHPHDVGRASTGHFVLLFSWMNIRQWFLYILPSNLFGAPSRRRTGYDLWHPLLVYSPPWVIYSIWPWLRTSIHLSLLTISKIERHLSAYDSWSQSTSRMTMSERKTSDSSGCPLLWALSFRPCSVIQDCDWWNPSHLCPPWENKDFSSIVTTFI